MAHHVRRATFEGLAHDPSLSTPITLMLGSGFEPANEYHFHLTRHEAKLIARALTAAVEQEERN